MFLRRALILSLILLSPFFAFANVLALRSIHQRQRAGQGAAASTGTINAGSVRQNPKDSQNYAWIPPGAFRMGCSPQDGECFDSEKPAHNVRISHGFWIGQTELTVAAFRAYGSVSHASIPDGQQGDRYPVVNVTWSEADGYCRWAGGRLPTEAEWEYAARGGVAAARYGTLDDVAWYAANSSGVAHEVAMKQPNRYGLYDMLGNVFEWVSDWYGEAYYGENAGLDPHGPERPQDDPLTPARGTGGHHYRVLRGGNFGLDSRYQRASCRLRHDYDRTSSGGGFRCVLERLPDASRSATHR